MRNVLRSRSRSARRRCPDLERLEDRTLPSSYTAATAADLLAALNASNTAGGTNTIALTAPSTSPYVLTAALPDVAAGNDLTITGNGDIIERSTDPSTPAFGLLVVDAGASLSVQDLTLENGDAPLGTSGGGILNQGTLTVESCAITGNTAQDSSTNAGGGGIANLSGTLTVDHSTISNNDTPGAGGGILNVGTLGAGDVILGTLTVTFSTIAGNTGNAGGGVANLEGSVTISSSTISGNSADTFNGGGIWDSGAVAGSGTTLEDSTLANNVAVGSGGAIEAQGTVTLAECTIADNSANYGGGIDNFYGNYSVSLVNTLLANNSASASGPDFQNGAICQGYNLVDNTEGSGGFGATGDLLNVNADLGPLADNGGPTQTLALSAVSPALAAGTTIVSLPATDQRGDPRTRNGTVDIGAYEGQPGPNTFQVSGFPTAISAETPGTVTVTALNADGTPDTSYSGPIHFTSTDPNAVLPPDTTLTGGTGTFSVTFVDAGVQALTVTDTSGLELFPGSETNIAVAPVTFQVSGLPSTITAETPGTVTVTALNPDGTPDTSYSGTISFASSDPSAVLPPDATLTGGTGTFSVTFETVGVQSLTVSDTSNPGFTGSETNIAVAPVTFQVSGFPTAVNDGISGTVTVTALNPDGTPDTSYSGTIQFTSSDPNAVLPPDTTLPGGAGTFSVTFETVGVQSLTVTDTSNPEFTGSETNIAVAPGFQVSGFPTAIPAGTPGTVTVTALNADGTPDTGYGGTIQFTSSDPNAVLPPDTTLTGGTGTFSVTFETAGVQTLTVSDTSDAGFTGSETNIPVAPVAFQVSGLPTAITAGTPGTVTVTALNTDGTPDTGYGGAIQFTSSDPNAVLPPDTTLTNGTGTFSITFETAGVQSLTVTDTRNPGFTASETNIAVAPGSPSQLVFQAVSTGSADPWLPTVSVDVEDAFGNAELDDSTGSVSLSLTGPADSQMTVPIIDGVASFTDLAVQDLGSYQLSASSPGLAGATTTVTNYAALTAADLLADLNTINAAPGANIITLTAPASAPYDLTAPLPPLAAGNDLILIGNGDMIERDAGATPFSLLVVDAGASLSVQDLTLENGDAPLGTSGGGILNHGTLTVENCVITGNTAEDSSTNAGGGGIANLSGTLTVDHSTLANNDTPGAGGGILNADGTLTITDSTLAGNTANTGGGVANLGGSVAINSSTIGANTVNDGDGGGVANLGGSVAINSSTISGNSAFGVPGRWYGWYGSYYRPAIGGAGGGIEAQGTVTIADSTIASNSALNGGGIDNFDGDYSISLVNTILANNSASTSGPDFQNGAISQGYNLVDNTAGSSGFGATGDLLNVNADLGPLADNGGPTQTLALSPVSPALAAGTTNVSLPATDQRGDPRTRDGTVDIGAYEVQPSPNTFQVSGFPTAISAGTPGTVTVTALNADGTPDTSYSGTIQFTSSDPSAVLPAETTLTGGTGTFSVTFETAGVQTLTVTDLNDLELFTGSETNIAVAPVTFQVSGFPTAISAGTPGTVTVTALNADGTPDTSYSGTIHFTSSDPSAVLPAETTLTGGTGTFSVTFETAGVQTLTVSDTINPGFSGSETNITVAPVTIQVSGFPTAISAGTPGTVTVTALNADGTPDTSYGDTIQFTSSDPSAVLPAETTLTGGTGTFSVTFETAAVQSLTVSDTSNPGFTGSETNIAVAPAAPNQLLFEQNSGGGGYGGGGGGGTGSADQLLPTVSVGVEDAFGNAEPDDSSGSVSLSVTGPGAFTADSQTTAPIIDGLATFTDLQIETAGSYQLSASSQGLAGATTALTVNPGAPSSLVLVQSPSGGTAGQPLSTVEVDILDSFGNLVTGDDSDTINLSLTGTTDLAAGQVQVQGGVAVFSAVVPYVAGQFRLVASAPGLAGATSDPFTIQVGPAARLTISQVPSTGIAGQPLGTVQATLVDDCGNIETAANGILVSLTVSGPGNFVADSTTTAPLVDGVATFSSVALDTVGDYVLEASSASAPQDCSVSLVVRAAPGQPGSTPLTTATPLFVTPADTASADGFLAGPRQFDLYSLSLGAGDTIGVSASGQQAGSGLNPLLRIFNAQGEPVALDDQEAGDAQLTFQAATAGEYYIGISSAPNDDYDPTVAGSATAGGTTGLYTLSVQLTPGAAAQANVAASSIRVATGTVAWGDTVPLTFSVGNRGGGEAGSFAVLVVLGVDGYVSDVLQTYSESGLGAGQAFSPGPTSVTLPSADWAVNNIGFDFTSVYLQIVIVSDPSQYDPYNSPAPLHRGEDWEPLTLVIPATASGSNLSAANPDLLTQPASAWSTDPNFLVTGTVSPGANEWYSFTPSLPWADGPSNTELNATVTAPGGAPTPQLFVYGPDGQILAQSDEATPGGTSAQIALNLSSYPDDAFELEVAAQGGGGSYQLLVQEAPAQDPLQPLAVAYGDDFSYSPNLSGPGLLVADLPDGQPDMIAAVPNGLDVRTGNGDGTFQNPYQGAFDQSGIFPLPPDFNEFSGPTPIALAAGDVAGDGILDLITANDDQTLDVMPIGDLGDLVSQTSLSHTPAAMVLADLTGDGLPDLIIANADGTVSELMNNGSGGFQDPVDLDLDGPGIGSVTSMNFLALADVNGDGYPDLLIPETDGAIHLFPGNGDGTFQPSRVIPVGGGQVIALTVADLTNNGRPDLVATTYDATTSQGTVTVLLNDGDGDFRVSQVIPVGGSELDSVGVGDFSGDGRLDIVASGSGTGFVFPGNGDGTFQPPVTFAVPPGSTTLAVADLTGNGRPDLLVCSYQDYLGQQIYGGSVFLNNGDGTFLSAPTLGALNLQSQTIVDLTGDGHADIVATRSDGVVELPGNGDGTFQPATLIAPGQTLVGVTDLNGDGRPDLVTDAGILLGNGDGTFQPLEPVPAGETILAVGTLTDDGIPDLIVGNLDGTLALRLGNGDGTFQPEVLIPGVADVQFVAIGDVTGDGIPDLVVDDNQGLQVLVGNGEGSFQPQAPVPVFAGDWNGNNVESIQLARFDDNAPPEIVVNLGNPAEGGAAVVLTSDGSGNFNQSAVFFSANVTVGDVYGNGQQDVIEFDSAGDLSVYAGNGDGTFQSPVNSSVPSGIISAAAADLTGNGLADLVTNEGVFLSNGDGTFRPAPQAGAIALRDTPQLVDLDGDGLQDSVVLDSSGDILFRKGLPGGLFAPPVVLNPGRPASDLAVVNIGTDWALAATDTQPVRNPDGSFTYNVSLYTLNPDETVNRTVAFSTSQQPERLAAGDLTGSGLDDLVATNPGDNSVSIALQTAPGQFGTPIIQPVGDEPSDICLTDVTGDGQRDIVVINQGDDTVSVLYNDATHSFANVATFRAGTSLADAVEDPTSGDLTSLGEPIGLVAGDFTGDGRNDLVVVDRATQSFTVLPNVGNGGFANPEADLTTSTNDATQVNVPGPVVAGYFNGPDQPLDLAVLMPDSNQVWIYTGDGQGHFTHTASIPAGDPPTGLALVPGSAPGLYDLLVGNGSGDVLRLVGDGQGSFQPVTETYDGVALAVQDLANGKPEALIADQQTNEVTIQAPVSTGPQFTPVQTLTVANATTQLAPGAVQWAQLDQDSPYEDAVVVCSGSNDVLVYRCTGFDDAGQPTFAPPVAYPVGDNPVSVTIADVTGDGIPDLLVANQGSNDISVLFGAYAANGDWIARDGPRLRSGGEGPVSVAVRDVTGDGIPDLVVTNGQSGTFTVLPGVGQGFFNDQNPQVLNVPGNPVLEAPSFFGTSDQGVVATADGQLIGFDLGDFAASVGIVFAPPAGEGVNAVEALADGHVVAALDGGTVVDLAPANGGLAVDQTFQSLTGIPSDPSALAVLQDESGLQVLVTNAGGDRVFVFGIPGLPESPALPPAEVAAGPTVEVTPPVEGSLTLVVTLIAGPLPAGDVAAAEVPQAGAVAAAPPPDPAGGGPGEGAEEVAAAEGDGSLRPGEGGIDLQEQLRGIDLYQPTPDPDRPNVTTRVPPGPGRRDGVPIALALAGGQAPVSVANPARPPADPEPVESWAAPAEVVRVVGADAEVPAQIGAREAADAVFVLPPLGWDAERLRLLALALAGFAWCAWSDGAPGPARQGAEVSAGRRPKLIRKIRAGG